jgi:hypothetical protein
VRGGLRYPVVQIKRPRAHPPLLYKKGFAYDLRDL